MAYDTFDVAIVGAGPAGSAAAVVAARAGAAVALIDRARFPRDKCCGDGLTTAALRHLEALGLDPSGLPSFCAVQELVVRSSSGRVATLPFDRRPGLAAAVCRRVELDNALVELARSAGATVLLGDAFSSIDTAGELLGLVLESGAALRAETAIGADGVWSPLRRALGASAPRGAPLHWHAFRSYATGVSDAAASQLLVSFEDEYLPGYAWSFPLAGGQANVGVCLPRVERIPGHELAAASRESLDGPLLTSFLGSDARWSSPLRSWPIPAPLGSVPLHGAAGRVLFVGDAARAADAFTGEGIAQALESGIAAAEAVAHDPASAAINYERALLDRLGRDAKLAELAGAAITRPFANRAVTALAARSGHLSHAFARWLYEDYPRALPLSPRHWGEGLSRRPLPYREHSAESATNAEHADATDPAP